MIKNIIIILAVIILVGACATTLLLNKQKIDQKAKLDGNLKSIPVFVMEVKPSK